ncbi:MAG: DUF1015 domain-containing protein [Gammaproteobacteria bacterium]|nr:DUF1015 domain-containing protein [Gammaproteobacteria bacterium]
MTLIKPFAALRPAAGRAADVVAPPYDVMNEAEARALVVGRPWSFLHISRPEVDLPAGTDPYSAEVYAMAAENLARMRDESVLVQDERPAYYLYQLIMGEHTQTGIVAAASVAAYQSGRIKKHEYTRPTKEDDRVRQIEALKAQTGPVFLIYRGDATVDLLLAETVCQPPEVEVTAADGVIHRIWRVDRQATIDGLSAAFESMPALYVADGHHRSAAAARVAGGGDEERDYFLAVIFPHDQVQILDYNRVVKDLNGQSEAQFLAALQDAFEVEASAAAVRPRQAGEFGLYLPGRWFRLRIKDERIPADNPVQSLDVSLLANELLQPLLGISDQRTDERIDFVGGIRGVEALQQRVDSGEMALAFALFPTGVEALLAVADAGEVMPPKSTWFEPKLADGLVSHLI